MIRSGFPEVPKLPVLERRQWVKENADYVRRALMYEPRGHHDMYGAILLPPYNDYADISVLFMHNEGYSTMCGHGIIAITTGADRGGPLPGDGAGDDDPLRDAGGHRGRERRDVKLDDGTLRRVAACASRTCLRISRRSRSRSDPTASSSHGTAAQYGALGVDIAFGGAYYGIVNAAELGLRVVPEQADDAAPRRRRDHRRAASRSHAGASVRSGSRLRLRHDHRRPRSAHLARRHGRVTRISAT